MSHTNKENLNIKEHIKGEVEFQFYKEGSLYYKTQSGITFEVPVNEAGTATFLAKDKAMLFMRYIRKHLEHMEAVRTSKIVFEEK